MPPLPVCVCRQGRAHSHVGGTRGREGGTEGGGDVEGGGNEALGRLAGGRRRGYFSRGEIESHTAAAVRQPPPARRSSSHSRFRKEEISKL